MVWIKKICKEEAVREHDNLFQRNPPTFPKIHAVVETYSLFKKIVKKLTPAAEGLFTFLPSVL